ncbi:MAG: WD40 repeat domain-containing protein [Anaerolineae bacterium]|nr:WD40 repeat domain-containing protein [Anaerolineae bacterium]
MSDSSSPPQDSPPALPDAQEPGTRAEINIGENANVKQAAAGESITQTYIERQEIFESERRTDVHGLENPYLGLKSFTYADHQKYAGREALIGETVAKMTAPGLPLSLLFVTGASGSGKSSFAQAGLIPALESHFRKFTVEHAVMRPTADPLAAFADALTRQLGLAAFDPPFLDNSETSGASLADSLTNRTPATQINLLVIDQFEEFFTQSPAVARDTFFAFLSDLPPFAKTRSHIIATMRADYLPELFNHPTLYEVAKRGVDLRVMSEEELRAAIQQPLFVSRYADDKRFEPALVNQLAKDAAQDAAYLPLLQVTLQEIWRKGSLTLGTYSNLTEAIQQRADQVLDYRDFDQVTPTVRRTDAEKTALLNLMLDLVDVSLDDDARRDVRRQRTKAELVRVDPNRLQLIQQLSDARLLSVQVPPQTSREMGADDNAQSRVDLIHESLLTNWARLRQAIAERREQLKQRGRFEQALDDWLDNARSADYLLEGVRLEQARVLKRENDVALQKQDAQEFLDASIRQAEAEQKRELDEERRRARRLRVIALIASGLFLLALAASVFAFQQQNVAMEQAVIAIDANETAQAEAEKRGTAEADALGQANAANQANATAQAERRIARSRELAAVALNQFQTYPEYALLLGILANESARTNESEDILRRAVLATPLTLRGHLETVNGAKFSPDGTKIVTRSFGNTAKVWDALTGRELATLEGHTETLSTAMFSPDGTKIVTASADGTAKVWDALTGSELVTLRGHDNYVASAVFSPDGKKIATGSTGDNAARVWDALTGKEIATLSGHTEGVWQVSFSPDSTKIVTESADTTAKVWNAATGNELFTLQGHRDQLTGVAFSHDGSKIVTASEDESAKVWDAATGKDLLTLQGHANQLTSAEFSHDDSKIVTASEDQTAKLWDVITGDELFTLQGHTGTVVTATFSPDDMKIVTAGRDGTARVWDAATGEELDTLQGHGGDLWSAAFSPDGTQIVTASADQSAKVWDDRWRNELGTLRGHTDDVTSVAFSPDGSQIVTSSKDVTAAVWDVAAARQIVTLQGHANKVTRAAFSPDGSKIATASEDHTAKVWDAATGEELATLRGHTALVWSAVFSPDGTKIVTASTDKTAKVWDVATGEELATLRGHPDIVWSAMFSPDGTKIVTGSADSTAKVWDAATGQELATLKGHFVGVRDATFSPDGTKIATASWDSLVKLWDAATGKELATLEGHAGFVSSAMFSPDGSKLVTAGSDKTAKLWDTATGKELATLRGHTRDVTSAAFSPDGTKIVTGSADDTARLYVANINDLIALARLRVPNPPPCQELARFTGEVCPTPVPRPGPTP